MVIGHDRCHAVIDEIELLLTHARAQARLPHVNNWRIIVTHEKNECTCVSCGTAASTYALDHARTRYATYACTCVARRRRTGRRARGRQIVRDANELVALWTARVFI